MWRKITGRANWNNMIIGMKICNQTCARSSLSAFECASFVFGEIAVPWRVKWIAYLNTIMHYQKEVIFSHPQHAEININPIPRTTISPIFPDKGCFDKFWIEWIIKNISKQESVPTSIVFPTTPIRVRSALYILLIVLIWNMSIILAFLIQHIQYLCSIQLHPSEFHSMHPNSKQKNKTEILSTT